MYLLWEIFFISTTIALPIFSQRTAYQSIDEDYFKKYKIKKFGFLFKGMQGQDACSHGVILPMLIIQIQGYVLGLAQLIFILISKSISFSDKYAIILSGVNTNTYFALSLLYIAGTIGCVITL